MAWLRIYVPSPPLLHCDNLSTLALSSNPVFHSRIKHLDTDFHFVRERVQRGDLLLHYVPTDEQIADVLTKGLHSRLFKFHHTNLRLVPPHRLRGDLNDEEKNEGKGVLSKNEDVLSKNEGVLSTNSSCHKMVLESPAVKLIRIGPTDKYV